MGGMRRSNEARSGAGWSRRMFAGALIVGLLSAVMPLVAAEVGLTQEAPGAEPLPIEGPYAFSSLGVVYAPRF